MADFKELLLLSIKQEVIKKIVFSRPKDTFPQKITARLCSNRGKRILATESNLPGNTVSQKNYRENEIDGFLENFIPKYNQINLITYLGDAELKSGKNGTVLLGADKLYRKLSSHTLSFESAIEELDRKKTYILSGEEKFLAALGISNSNGRVHDKKQAKFRQINKFLEYLEEVYNELPKDKELLVYDLCCGKSYLSFAVYHYLTNIKQRKVYILGIDIKKDVMDFCNSIAREAGFDNMHFITDDINNAPKDKIPDMVISLHACDIATDIVLNTAAKLSAKVILSTPCCHRELSTKINSPYLEFVTKYPKLKRSLCDTLTDALRLERLSALGYEVNATELVDPEDTPKNTLIRAIKRKNPTRDAINRYNSLVDTLINNGEDNTYIGKIKEDDYEK